MEQKPRLPSPQELAHDLAPTDLAEVARAAEKKRLEEAQRLDAARRLVAERWDNAMQRAFKGILTRRERHAMLKRAHE